MADTDSETEELRERALHLAAEVAETDDCNVPVLLLRLKDILDECRPNSALGKVIRNDLWGYDVIHVCNLALKQDFAAIDGHWDTASKLSAILCQCCIGLELPEIAEYKETFLPDVVENVLTLAAKLHDLYCKLEKVNQQAQLLSKCLRTVVYSFEYLLSFHKHLSVCALECKRFIQMLMSEDLDTSLMFLNILGNSIKRNRNTLSELSPNVMHGILDELVYKISASEETFVGRIATHIILVITDMHPPTVPILLSKRYRGLKAYLSKWKGRGFDHDVKRLVELLEAGTIAQAEQLKLERAATIIQAAYRSFLMRRKLQRANRGFAVLQRKFREKRLEKEIKKAREKEDAERKDAEERRKIHHFRSSMRKQMKMLETLPAREVNLFMAETQEKAATSIQAGYRGMLARRETAKLKHETQKHRAAVVIQRQYRRYRKRKEGAKVIYPIPAGLTDARRVELQNIIVQRREKLPPKHRSFEELKELHEKTHSLLAHHVMLCGKSRKGEQRREALLARLKIDSDQLLAAPKLEANLNPDVIGAFTSNSAPVIARAQLNHNEEMCRHKQPWWKKLWDESDNIDPLPSRLSWNTADEELNF